MSATPWVVTSRNQVHRRDSDCAARIAFPKTWSPDATGPRDYACPKCLDGALPTAQPQET